MSQIDTDLILLQRFAASRDEAVFAQIVQRYAGLVYAASLRVLGNAAQAEEVSQDTFLRLLRRPEAVTRSLGGWLHRAATQQAIDVLRSESSRRQRERTYSREGQDQAGAQDPAHALHWREMGPHVDQALEELPEEERELLVRHFLQSVPQNALAQEMGVSPATMSRRMRASLDALRQRLAQRGVAAPAVALPAFLYAQAAVAAPATLLAELGKMAMVSGAATAASAAGSARMSGAAKVAAIAGVCLLQGFMLLWYVAHRHHAAARLPSPPATATSPAEVSASLADLSGDDALRHLLVPNRPYILGLRDDYDGRAVTTFVYTPDEKQGTFALAFGDGHVKTVSFERGREQIERQTGRPLRDMLTATRGTDAP